MKTERIMKEIKEYIFATHANMTESIFNMYLEEGISNDPTDKIFKLYKDLKEDLRKEVCRSKNPGQSKIINKMQERSPEQHMNGFHKYKDGFVFTDGRRALVCSESFGLEACKNMIDEKRFKGLLNFTTSKEIEVNVEDLKAFVKEHAQDVKKLKSLYLMY